MDPFVTERKLYSMLCVSLSLLLSPSAPLDAYIHTLAPYRTEEDCHRTNERTNAIIPSNYCLRKILAS